MKKKFIFTSTGKPITIGDTISVETALNTRIGKISKTITFEVTSDNWDTLVKKGFIKEDTTNQKAPALLINNYVISLADKLGWTPDKMKSYLDKLTDIYPAAVWSLLLRVIAKRLDKKYSDHISKSKEIWVISTLDGKAHRANKERITNYKNFAAFRSKEDAEFALNVLAPFTELIFNSEDEGEC